MLWLLFACADRGPEPADTAIEALETVEADTDDSPGADASDQIDETVASPEESDTIVTEAPADSGDASPPVESAAILPESGQLDSGPVVDTALHGDTADTAVCDSAPVIDQLHAIGYVMDWPDREEDLREQERRACRELVFLQCQTPDQRVLTVWFRLIEGGEGAYYEDGALVSHFFIDDSTQDCAPWAWWGGERIAGCEPLGPTYSVGACPPVGYGVQQLDTSPGDSAETADSVVNDHSGEL